MSRSARKAEPRGEDTPDKWTEERVLALIQARHPSEQGEWAFFTHLRSKTGYATPGRESYLDAFAMSCWPSGGFARVAYEVKVSRSDFLNELRDPGKRDEGMKLANEFWYAAPLGVIKDDEVPEGCGWLLADAGGLKVKKAAPYREVALPSLSAVASILRNAVQRQGKVSTRELKAFKYAGRDITVEELLALAKDEDERWRERDVTRRLEEKLHEARANMPEVRLTRAVAEAMGRKYDYRWPHDTPNPTAFAMWAEAQRLGVPVDAVSALKRARQSFENATTHLKAAEEAFRVSHGVSPD